jgi:hypothetical protein
MFLYTNFELDGELLQFFGRFMVDGFLSQLRWRQIVAWGGYLRFSTLREVVI